MFIEALIVSVIIGYISKGKLRNIDTNRIKGIYLVFIGFFIEAIIVILIKNGLLARGIISYLLDAVMYLLLFLFIYLNRKNKWVVLMGIGFFLNALPIFLNGGAMPVSTGAVDTVGITRNVTSEGLYVSINSSTKLAFLGDIIPIKYPRPFAASIGDLIAAIGLMLFIITGMKRKKGLKYLI